MKLIKQEYLTGERALFQCNHLHIVDSIFAEGESPLKESGNLEIDNTIFKWKYPLWYSHHIKMEHSTLLETARSGIWYTHHIEVLNSTIEAPKAFRRSSDITLNQVTMPLAQETFWNCDTVKMTNVNARGDYFALNSKNIYAEKLTLTGNYAFDGVTHIEIHDSTLISKDCFWNCEDVVVYDSTIIGEYLGWNSKNMTFVNCTIESLQGLCYVENLKLINCKVINTSLAFEYSTVEAEITSHLDSVKNPISGTIRAESIGHIILEEDKIDPSKTTIEVAERMLL